VIEVAGLTKRFGRVVAVEELTFRVEPGVVTGFLGPNGAGKSTTLRVLLGLLRADRGTALVLGRRYPELDAPARRVGAVLESDVFHAGRTGRNHLRVVAAAAEIPETRVDEVLELVDLTGAAGRRAGGYSLGMRQRLGIATALLGNPQVLVLDEPANGLDPAGIRWLRQLLRGLAGEGRTVFLSSHVLSEMEQTADRVVVIHRGRLVVQGSIEEITSRAVSATRVRSPRAESLAELFAREGIEVTATEGDMLRASAPPARVGELAAASGIVLHELVGEAPGLEEAFLELTRDEP
jgi:ABC-2 type transport system ATP-binding protein